MLVISWAALENLDDTDDYEFEIEYSWENFIIRIWFYRTTVNTLTKLSVVDDDAQNVLKLFDKAFDANG